MRTDNICGQGNGEERRLSQERKYSATLGECADWDEMAPGIEENISLQI